MSVCGVSEVIEGNLLKKYDELPMADGEALIYSEGLEKFAPGLLTIWVNRDTLSFSVVLKFADGISCVLLTGDNFRPATREPEIKL